MASQVNGSGIEIYLVGRRSRRLKAVVARFKWLTLGLFGGHDLNDFDDSSVKGKRSRG